MAVTRDRSRKVLLLGSVGLLLTLTALGTAAWALLRAESERGKRRAHEAAEEHAQRLLTDLVRTARGSRSDEGWVVLDAAGELLRPAAPRRFVALPPIGDEEAVFALDRFEVGGEGGALRQAAVWRALQSDDAAARLAGAVSGARLGLPAASMLAEAMLPVELLETRDATWLALKAGSDQARERALVRIGGPGEDAAAALLIGTAADERAALDAIERRREALADAADLRRLLDAASPVSDRQTDRVLVLERGVVFVALAAAPPALEDVPGAAWWLVLLPEQTFEDIVHHVHHGGFGAVEGGGYVSVFLPGQGAELPSALLPGSGYRVVVREGDSPASWVLIAGFGVASIAALLAFAAFARAVLRESRLARLRSEFVATVGHELRTPVAVIRSSAEALALGRARSDDDRAQLVGGIVRESERLSGLLGNVLDFARMEAGRRRFSFAVHDVSDIVRDAVAAHGAALQRAGVDVELDLDPDTPPLPLDRDAISAAVVNLLDNAAKFGAGAPVVVRTRNDAGEAVVEVVDRGPGVPDPEKPRVFERFFRGAGDDVRETRGSGIGLALVRHAAEAHGGLADVVDTPGGGATFRIVLPVRSTDEIEGS